MQVEAKLVDKANAKASVKINAKELEEKCEELAKDAAKNMNIQGFRKGKVPVKVVLDRYKDGLINDAKNKLLRDSIAESLKIIDKDFEDLIGEPVVSKINEKDGDIKAEVEISFKPKVKIKDIDKLIPEFSAPKVTKKEVEERLSKILEMFAPVVKSDKEQLEKGDYAKFDFEGFLDGVAFEGGKAQNYVLEIGSGQFIPGFEDGMIGLKVGEQKDIKVTFPKDYGAPNLAGKDAIFKVKLHEIQQKGKAKLDDELLKKLLPNEKEPSKEKLHENIEKQLKNEKFDKVLNDELKPKFADALVENFDFDLPKNILDQEIDMRFRNDWPNFTQEEKDQFKDDKKAIDEKRKTYKKEAAKSVKLTFIINELAKVKNIELSDQELIQAIYFEAYRNGLDPKQHLENYKNQGMLPAIKMALIEEKLFAQIFSLEDKQPKDSE